MSKQRVYITSGVSGSGKSTYIKKHNLDSVSTDEIVENYAKENGFNYTEAFDEIQSRKLFGAINSIFFDNIIHNIKIPMFTLVFSNYLSDDIAGINLEAPLV